MEEKRNRVYGGSHPSELAAYTPTQAARYIGLPVNTVRSWVYGIEPSNERKYRFQPVISPDDEKGRLLSFTNLIELHVLASLRRRKGIDLKAIRKAQDYLQREQKRPLATLDLLVCGSDIFIEKYGELINVTQNGQIEMKKVLEVYLSRIERDRAGLPLRLFPFTNRKLPLEDAPKSVEINPLICFGRPCVAGSGIPTFEIAERFLAGDSVKAISLDFNLSASLIEEAIRFEQKAKAA